MIKYSHNSWCPAEKRLKIYDIKKYISKEKSVLAIGTNCSFFIFSSLLGFSTKRL